MRETTTSWIVLTGLFAYKIKRPVRLEFLDMTDPARRRELCEEELRLNRRLAADLYLDVVPISRIARGLRVGEHGPVVDYAVRMNQFDGTQELAALLERGSVDTGEIAALAQRLADFHAHAPRAARQPDFPHTGQLRDAVLGTLATFLAHGNTGGATPGAGRLIDWTHDFLHDKLDSLRRREPFFIRECHGDLHSRNIVRWRGRLVPFDCLEFDPKLRWIDVMNDTAFLIMDLLAHDRRDLAFGFLNAYLERSGDYTGVGLLPFYAVYRALVRAMVDTLALERQPQQAPELQIRLHRRMAVAAGLIESAAPLLILMHGPSGSGKSWLGARLAAELQGVRMRSDVERKRLQERGDTAQPVLRGGVYSSEFNRLTYAHLRDCAAGCLEGRVHTVVDAAFLDAAERRAFLDLARRMGSTCFIVSMSADREELERRIRARRGTDPSDADESVLAAQLRQAQPLTADERVRTIEADTRDPTVCARVAAAIRASQQPGAARDHPP